jgi:hypothetical protein
MLKRKRSEKIDGEAKKLKQNEAKKLFCPLCSLEHAKTKQNGSRFTSFFLEVTFLKAKLAHPIVTRK